MTGANDYDDPDEYLDDEDTYDDQDAEEWREGECDHCYGETVNGPLGPIFCACQIGQGADEDDCVCGPPTETAA